MRSPFNQIHAKVFGAIFWSWLNLFQCFCFHSPADENTWATENQVSLNYRMGFNLPLKFKNIGSPAFHNQIPANGKPYQDGFVGTDDTGNAGGVTTYWGYGAGAFVPSDNSVMVLHNSTTGDIGPAINESQNSGAELNFDHKYGQYKSCSWGIESALNWLDYLGGHQIVAPAPGVLSADAFALGYFPPLSPYTGPYASAPFSPVLGSIPTPVPVTVDSTFNAKIYGARLGPYFDWHLNRHITFSHSAGLSVSIIDGKFRYTVSNPMENVTSTGQVDGLTILPGGYIKAQTSIRLFRSLSMVIGGQFQSCDTYQLTIGNKQAEIDLSQQLYYTAGFCWSF